MKQKQLVEDDHWEKTGRELIILRSIQGRDSSKLFNVNMLDSLHDPRFIVLLNNARIYFQERYERFTLLKELK